MNEIRRSDSFPLTSYTPERTLLRVKFIANWTNPLVYLEYVTSLPTLQGKYTCGRDCIFVRIYEFRFKLFRPRTHDIHWGS